ncbi:MAG: L-idonate 5-dehydrogenase [Alphaproteobacteria bacterium]|nr:L-idonate 5-dehydrogenase [Alphaproteobacteria bacterium]
MSALTSAILIHGADDLRVGEVETLDPGPGEVSVRVTRGGISTADLALYKNGLSKDLRQKQALIPGSEIAGTVIAIGSGVNRVQPGDRVAVNPLQTCGYCLHCRAGRSLHCSERRFFGSNERSLPTQGGFRQTLTCTESQAVPTGQDTPADRAAFAASFAQALHAVRRSGTIAGQRVYISGCGPVGLMTILAARHAGAREIIAGDLTSKPLQLALRLGADSVINVSTETDALKSLQSNQGMADLAFETAGTSVETAMALSFTRPGGRIIHMAPSGETALPLDLMIAKEIECVGAFHFDDEFEWAVDLLAKRAVDVAPLLGAAMPFRNARAAFDLAGDRAEATKVQLVFE